ncbi:hypothetical protein E3N88_36385 [Mikania micrantha]|uniref:Uncharacterized protein n=1 Tax=Mikania micrantha TaxID=192012 RepID=A0A5N6M3L4_9ASTR|nr:hypothetical protein E3N88_36385 [Mikania micrantha]
MIRKHAKHPSDDTSYIYTWILGREYGHRLIDMQPETPCLGRCYHTLKNYQKSRWIAIENMIETVIGELGKQSNSVLVNARKGGKKKANLPVSRCYQILRNYQTSRRIAIENMIEDVIGEFGKQSNSVLVNARKGGVKKANLPKSYYRVAAGYKITTKLTNLRIAAARSRCYQILRNYQTSRWIASKFAFFSPPFRAFTNTELLCFPNSPMTVSIRFSTVPESCKPPLLEIDSFWTLMKSSLNEIEGRTHH